MTFNEYLLLVISWTLFWVILVLTTDRNSAKPFIFTAIGIVGVYIICYVSPDEKEMRHNAAIKTLNSRPACVLTAPDDIHCLEVYKEWLADSADAAVKLGKI